MLAFPRRSTLARLAAACIVLAVSDANLAEAVPVRVDGLSRHQTMQGFGSSERVFDDPHVFENFNPATGRALTTLTATQQDEVLDRLYRDLRLTRVRAIQPDGGGIEPVNDNADPLTTDLAQFKFGWKLLDDHCAYFARARQRGATLFYLSPVMREPWMGASTTGEAAEYAEWLLAQVRRCAELGVRLPYVSVGNEPSQGSFNPMSGTFVRDVVKALGPRLLAEGFETKFVVADDIRPSAAAQIAEIVLSDPAARAYVGAVATHLYGEPVSAMAQVEAVADRYGIPLWMTEFYQRALPEAGLTADPFTWAWLMHTLIASYDVSAIDYMWGFFGTWVGDDQLIGLTESGGTYTGYVLNKVYYTFGQFSRFVPPGAVRVGTESSDPSVSVTAFVHDGRLTIVGVNDTQASRSLEFQLTGLPPIAQMQLTRTSETESWAPLPPIAVGGSAFDATLPPRSVSTFVSDALPITPPDGLAPPGNLPAAGGQGLPGARLPADVTPPRLSGLRLSRRRFSPGRSGRRGGTTISFYLSEPAAVTLRFGRVIGGRRVRGRCLSPRAGARARRCTRVMGVRGAVRVVGRRGANRLRFAGRLPSGKRLRGGRYRMTALARDGAGNTSPARAVDFVLVRPGPR